MTRPKWLDDKAKMAFCQSFLNHMKWQSQPHTLHLFSIFSIFFIIERDLSLLGLSSQKFYLLDFNYGKHLLQ